MEGRFRKKEEREVYGTVERRKIITKRKAVEGRKKEGHGRKEGCRRGRKGDRIAEYIETPGGVSSATLAEYWLGHAPLSNLTRACVYIVIYVYILR